MEKYGSRSMGKYVPQVSRLVVDTYMYIII